MSANLGSVLLAAALLYQPAWANADTRADYLLHCGGCHLPDGRGTPPEVPTLRNELGKLVAMPGGRDYLVRVPGASQAPIDDASLARIVNWILFEFNQTTLEAQFTPLTAREVTRSRGNVLLDPLKHRAKLWENY